MTSCERAPCFTSIRKGRNPGLEIQTTLHSLFRNKVTQTNLPSQIKSVKLQKNLDHHRHAAMNKSKSTVMMACFITPCALLRSLLLSRDALPMPGPKLSTEAANKASSAHSGTQSREACFQLLSWCTAIVLQQF